MLAEHSASAATQEALVPRTPKGEAGAESEAVLHPMEGLVWTAEAGCSPRCGKHLGGNSDLVKGRLREVEVITAVAAAAVK